MTELTGYGEIVELLTHRVRVLADSQVAQYRGIPVKIARQGLRRLEKQGLITLQPVMLHPPLALELPLVEWWPHIENASVNWDSVAWRAESRWNKPPSRMLIACATRKARMKTGGPLGGRQCRALEASHDVTLSELLLRQDPTARQNWIPEDALTEFGAGEKRPDAVLRLDDGREVFIELAGKAYSARRLSAIHQAFASRGSHYRIY